MKLYKGEDSLTEIKNYIGGTVSYEELRWYKGRSKVSFDFSENNYFKERAGKILV